VFELAEPGSRLTGFEALVRWLHPQQGLLGATAFLTLAEDSGLMQPLTDFVLHCACQQLRQWQQLAPALAGLTMSVNLSAHDLADGPGQQTLAARVSQAVVESGIRAEQLGLELTESHLLTHAGSAAQTLAALHRLGVKLAVDDFGGGHSSLSQLCHWPIDSLKIDRQFVVQQPSSASAVTVLEAAVQLGQALRKTVVAEGIETLAHLQRVQALGCRYGQGFYLGRPLDAADTADWLRRLHPAA
jgi:EAL domain-containing protein (putative c-di-GMP-specific phosphodiesterase class I)